MAEIKRQGPKSGVWKLQNSIWLILTFIPFIQWSAFFYIANRTDCKKFRIVGNVVLAADMSAILAAFLSMIVRCRLEEVLIEVFWILLLLIVPFSIIAGILCLNSYWKALALRSVHSDGIETITGQSHIWELKKTAWVCLGFVPLLFFTAFIFPAIKMKNKLYWAYFGLFGALSAIFISLVLLENDNAEVILLILFISHVFSLSLLMNIRAKYLKFINRKELHSTMTSLLQGGATVSETLKSEPKEATLYTKFGSSDSPSASSISTPSHSSLNVNICSEEELAALPGLNIIDAKKAISLREQNGDFASIEDFITALHIKPHIAAPLYDYITVQPSFKATPQSTARTRKIDL